VEEWSNGVLRAIHRFQFAAITHALLLFSMLFGAAGLWAAASFEKLTSQTINAFTRPQKMTTRLA
jgi:hypothetical protein